VCGDFFGISLSCCSDVVYPFCLLKVFFVLSCVGGALGYNDQPLTYRDYANMYYRDFFFYTREKRSSGAVNDAGLIMSRPVDCLVDSVSKVRQSVWVQLACTFLCYVCVEHSAVVRTVSYSECRLV
jgi:hypothetical protein